MARADRRLPENVPGDFYVDDTCIDCTTCRVIAPGLFAGLRRGYAYVARQPGTDREKRRALAALASCPTASIGTLSRQSAEPGVKALPEEVSPGVLYCGFASASSFGAASYLVRRPEGNVLVDSPRAAGPLLRRLEELGGVRTIVLTHRDDVADHARLRAHFGAERVMHEDDLTVDTRGVERVVRGRAPVALAPDLLLVPVPGHTPGSLCLLYRQRELFSGDHLFAREDGGGLYASREVCWWSWPEQVRSLGRLRELTFEHVLPGHGGRYQATDSAAMRDELDRLLARLGG